VERLVAGFDKAMTRRKTRMKLWAMDARLEKRKLPLCGDPKDLAGYRTTVARLREPIDLRQQ
jgi:hypothetical protein